MPTIEEPQRGEAMDIATFVEGSAAVRPDRSRAMHIAANSVADRTYESPFVSFSQRICVKSITEGT